MASSSTERQPCDLPSKVSTHSFWHTQPSPALLGHRTTRHLPKKADVVIIGSGITGASIAHHLLAGNDDADISVVILEAREACWGATGRNGGHCQPLFFEHPEDPSIGHFEYRNYLTLAKMISQQDIDCEFVRQPSVRAIYGETQLKHAQEALLAITKTTPELASMMHVITSKDELAKYRIPSASGAMYTSQAARLWPYKLVAHVLESLLDSPQLEGSFNLQTLTPVNSIKQHGSTWMVKTARGDIDAGAVFLATNGYTSHLLPSFSDLIVPCRGEMSALLPSPSLAGSNRLTTSMGFEAPGMDDYLIQRQSGQDEHLMFGGGRLLGPSLGITDDSVIDEKVAAYLRKALPQHLDLGDDTSVLHATHQWTGIMGWSRDGLPWVGQLPNKSNLYISAGYTGHGMPNAWLCGKAISEMYLNRDQGRIAASRSAQESTGLPTAYLVTQDRMAKAMLVAAPQEPSMEARSAWDQLPAAVVSAMR